MTEREQIMHALNCAAILPLLPSSVTLHLCIIGGALRAFAVDTRSGAPAVRQPERATIRARVIAGARGFAAPFAWWLD